MATISYHELTELERHARCIYGLTRDGNDFAHCGNPATIIQRITYSDGATENRPYCTEHEQIERAIPT